MDRSDGKSIESVIKNVLEVLRMYPGSEFSELELEQKSRDKLLNKPERLERLRNNPKIVYSPITARYMFKPTYQIKKREDLLDLIN